MRKFKGKDGQLLKLVNGKQLKSYYEFYKLFFIENKIKVCKQKYREIRSFFQN